MQRRQLEAPVEDRRLTGGVKATHPFDVRTSKVRRDDRVREIAANRLGPRPPEGRSGLRVPVDDPSLCIDADEGVVRRIQNRVGARLALGQPAERAAQLLIGHRHRDQIGH